jgi:flagella synthesis protein FlgN
MSLGKLLDDQHRRLDILKARLEEELESLTRGQVNGDRLLAIARDKQALLEELEAMERRRRRAQQKLGYREGIQGARQAALDAGCLEAWESMRALTERTARLNDLAGQLVSMRMEHNQHMLDFIHSVSEKTLYDPRGRAGSQSGRLNASA